MTMIQKSTGLLLLLAAVLLLAACRPAQALEPTPDADMIRTAAVLTVEAELTEQALSNPTPTNTDTPTPEPTATSDIPTLMPLSLETQSSENGGPTAAQPSATQAPPPASSVPDKATWISNIPADGAVLQPGQKFEIRWTVRNTGSTTWNTSYTIRFFSGNINTVKNTYNFRGETKPESTVELIVEAVAPTAPGEYYTWWKLTNDQGVNFGDVDLYIKVEGAVVPTATSNP